MTTIIRIPAIQLYLAEDHHLNLRSNVVKTLSTHLSLSKWSCILLYLKTNCQFNDTIPIKFLDHVDIQPYYVALLNH